MSDTVLPWDTAPHGPSSPRDTVPHPFPRLQKAGRATQLIVDGAPFLVLGGELGNSSASDPAELPAMFAGLRRMRLNTVLVPAYWDRAEPEEGRFDFSLVQAAVEAARGNDLRLVLLWFGTWKNSMSCYAPGWVKRDTDRFPRVRLRSGEAVEIVSPASAEARDADARAFAALMRWLRGFDGDRRTVLMAQVENEAGMIPEPRDHSPEAGAAYRGAVPDALLSRLAGGELGPEVAALWRAAGGRPAGERPATGRRSSARSPKARRSSPPGSSPPTSRRWRPQGGGSTRCRCSRTPR